MKHKVKILGMAIVAAFAMNAMFASGAQALKADVEGGGKAFLTGSLLSHNGSNHHSFNTFFGSITCTNVSFTGEVADGDPELTITPSYSGCTTSGKPTTIDMEGCDYRFSGGEAKGGGHFTGIGVALLCPESVAGPRVTVFKSSTHTAGNIECEYLVDKFTTTKLTNTATNTTTPNPDDVDVTSEVSGIKTTRTAGSFFTCGSIEQTSTYRGGTTLTGYSDAGHKTQIGILIE